MRTSIEPKDKPQKGWVLEALDLQGLREWPELEQEQAREQLLKWEHLFPHSNLDLGKTALMKHKIVVLVQKKDSSLRFCIDLRKMNSGTIKDAYSLPHIDETLNSL